MSDIRPVQMLPKQLLMDSDQHPLSYIKYGSGPTVWLALHGIGQDASAFAPFGEKLAQTHTLYSLNLPFHGPDILTYTHTNHRQDAKWPLTITKPYWQRLLTDFLVQHGINRFSVAGFSMGGRFALVTAELFAERLEQLIVLAPDGVTENAWFRLATGTAPGRAALRFMLGRTGFFHEVGEGLVRLKLLHPGLLRFAEATMKAPAQRRQLYRSWTAFRTMQVDLTHLARQLEQHAVKTYLILGKYDAVLPASHTEPLLLAVPQCEVIVLPTGHTSLIRKAAELPL